MESDYKFGSRNKSCVDETLNVNPSTTAQSNFTFHLYMVYALHHKLIGKPRIWLDVTTQNTRSL